MNQTRTTSATTDWGRRSEGERATTRRRSQAWDVPDPTTGRDRSLRRSAAAASVRRRRVGPRRRWSFRGGPFGRLPGTGGDSRLPEAGWRAEGILQKLARWVPRNRTDARLILPGSRRRRYSRESGVWYGWWHRLQVHHHHPLRILGPPWGCCFRCFRCAAFVRARVERPFASSSPTKSGEGKRRVE